jgi:Bacterial membrane protein YfhO.
MKKFFEQHKMISIWVLFLIMSVVIIYTTDLKNGHIWSYLDIDTDGRFHVLRIEGLYQALKQGQLFPVVNMAFMGGFGYISNVFYADLWLYPAAILRLIGLTTAQAFVTYYVILNFATFLIAFYAYRYVSHNDGKGLLFSFIYTLSAYRIFDMVRRFDIGETLTLTFLPIVILGIYEIFYDDSSKWYFLTLGMVMVIYAHALSPILIGMLIFCVILFRIKTLIREPRRILRLVYSGLLAGVFSLAYFLPMFEQLNQTKFKLTSPLVDVAQRSNSLKDIFTWSFNNDLYQEGIGLVLIIVAIAIPFVVWKVKNPAVRDFAIIGEIFLIMTSKLFPWGMLENTPLKIIQFPWRLNMLVTILFSIFLAADPLHLFAKKQLKVILVGFILVLTLNSELLLVRNYPHEYDTYTSFNHLDSYSIGSGEEYLPKQASLKKLEGMAHVPTVAKGSVEITGFKQNGSKISFNFNDANDARINLPIIGYYGYSSKNSLGNVSALKMDRQTGLGQVTLNGKGTVRVDYYQTWIQKSSRIISISSLLIFFLTFYSKKKRMKK